MCPGITMSLGSDLGSASTRIVRARSAADTPVVMPWRASTETVKAVPYWAWLLPTMRGMRRWSRRSPERGTQMMPLV